MELLPKYKSVVSVGFYRLLCVVVKINKLNNLTCGLGL